MLDVVASRKLESCQFGRSPYQMCHLASRIQTPEGAVARALV